MSSLDFSVFSRFSTWTACVTYAIQIIKKRERERERERITATFWLQEPGNVKGIMCNSESLFQIFLHGVFQGLLHVDQAGVNGLDYSQESHPTSPAARKVLHSHAIPGETMPQWWPQCRLITDTVIRRSVEQPRWPLNGVRNADLARQTC